ncbi:MAG: metallophosphoesterase family protein [Phycisphaerae bacterium]|nr:metallophosphoesterase family protein [Phycisphaerae bacterium]
MKIGILSDSHGKSALLVKGLGYLTDAPIDAIVHCGDIVNTDGIQLLGEAGVPAYLVAGNMDICNFLQLQAAAEKCGVTFAADFVTVPLGNGDGKHKDKRKKYLAATHGNTKPLLEELICDGQYRYVCHGHTHQPIDVQVNSTRVLNPGSLFNPRGGHGRSVMILDTDTDTVKIIAAE